MDYYNYINQRQVSLDGRHSSAADFTAGDDGSSRFSLSGGRGGDERYFSSVVLARCGASTFVDGQRHLDGVRLDGSAVANGELSPGRESASFTRPFATSTNAGTCAAADVDTLACGGAPRTSATANDRHAEPTASTSLHGHHQLQRLRYLPPPPGSVLPPLDDDDDVASPAADGRSSAGSTQSSTSGSRHHPAAAVTSGASGVDQTQRAIKTDDEDSAVSEKSDKVSTNAAAAASGLTSTQPLIYPWMRRVHSSNSGML